MKTALLVASAFLVFSLLSAVRADVPPPARAGISTKMLIKAPLTGDDTREVVIGSAELAPGATLGRHSHPGDEFATVVQGSVEILFDGQSPKRVEAGEAFHNSRGVIHETRNAGQGPARLISTFIIDKGRPVLEPAKEAS